MPIFFSCQSEKVATVYPNHVGDIEFDDKVDDVNFKKCLNDKFSFQYYNTSKGLEFKGEKITIEKKLEQENIRSSKDANGYITIRFVVNCEGKTGMFRVQAMNEKYQKIDFHEKFINQLLDFTKQLNGWIPKEYDGHKIDYYQYLTYKIENGKVSEILP